MINKTKEILLFLNNLTGLGVGINIFLIITIIFGIIEIRIKYKRLISKDTLDPLDKMLLKKIIGSILYLSLTIIFCLLCRISKLI